MGTESNSTGSGLVTNRYKSSLLFSSGFANYYVFISSIFTNRANCINVHSNSSSLLLSFVQDHYQLLPLFNFSLQKSSRSSHHTQRHLPEKKKKKAKYIYFALNSGVWGRLGMVRRKYDGKYFLLCAGIAEGMESTHSTAQHMQFRDRKLKK